MTGDRSRDLPAAPQSVRVARAIVREAADGLPPGVVEDAELLVSELVSNAVRHGGAGIRLSVWSRSGVLSVSVFDAGAGLPALRNTDVESTATSGRGLRMVAQLADDWGVEIAGGDRGKAVWFRLAAVRATGEKGSSSGTSDERGRAEGHGADHHAAR